MHTRILRCAFLYQRTEKSRQNVMKLPGSRIKMEELDHGFSELVYPFNLTKEPLMRASLILCI